MTYVLMELLPKTLFSAISLLPSMLPPRLPPVPERSAKGNDRQSYHQVEILNFAASPVAPFIRILAPVVSRINPAMINK